jgi:hypothetical protein
MTSRMLPSLKLSMSLKIWALGFTILFFFATGCSKQQAADAPAAQPTVETFPISNSKLTNCHFQTATATYSSGAAIAPNPIICAQGVPTSVQVLNPTPLPSGIAFSMDQLSLTGTSTVKLAQTPYQFYLENEAGYVIINLQLTVQ